MWAIQPGAADAATERTETLWATTTTTKRPYQTRSEVSPIRKFVLYELKFQLFEPQMFTCRNEQNFKVQSFQLEVIYLVYKLLFL